MMDALIKNISDPAWWMAVVVGGILINLVAAYMKPAIDKIAAWLYPRMAGSLRMKAEEFEDEVASLRASSEHRIQTQLLKIEYLVKIIGAFLLSIYLSLAASRAATANVSYLASILRVAGFLAGMYSIGCTGRYVRLADTLRQAWRKGIKNNGTSN
jgi:hypothetical protein